MKKIIPLINTIENFHKIESIDLYVNYSCGLRCNHCFIGEILNSNIEMPLELAKSIIDHFQASGIHSITLLGGEPSLYSGIKELINYITSHGQIEVRIVTNGQKSLRNLILNLPEKNFRKLHVCFSIDGSNSNIHDFIRGKGTFSNLMSSIDLIKSKKISFSGITSISKDNYGDTQSIIRLCSSFKMKYLNVHYVTDRGFAKRNNIVSVQDWLELCKIIESQHFDLQIRLEKTFVPTETNISCEVLKKNNIIIDPLGKIYGCTMFMDFKNSETATWGINGLEQNKNELNENSICKNTKNGCPAMSLVNKELIQAAKTKNLKMDCIFNKSTFEKKVNI